MGTGNKLCYYTLLFFGGRQPLCGKGVISLIITTSIPEFARERIEPSLPAPGPFTYTSTLRTPASEAVFAASAAAICAAYGVFFLEPLNPILPALLQEITWPFLFVKLMMMLLKLAVMCASPYESTFTILFFAAAFALSGCCVSFAFDIIFVLR